MCFQILRVCEWNILNAFKRHNLHNHFLSFEFPFWCLQSPAPLWPPLPCKITKKQTNKQKALIVLWNFISTGLDDKVMSLVTALSCTTGADTYAFLLSIFVVLDFTGVSPPVIETITLKQGWGKCVCACSWVGLYYCAFVTRVCQLQWHHVEKMKYFSNIQYSNLLIADQTHRIREKQARRGLCNQSLSSEPSVQHPRLFLHKTLGKSTKTCANVLSPPWFFLNSRHPVVSPTLLLGFPVGFSKSTLSVGIHLFLDTWLSRASTILAGCKCFL